MALEDSEIKKATIEVKTKLETQYRRVMKKLTN
jgi:hypothetical protein